MNPIHGFHATARDGLFHGAMHDISRYIESVSSGWSIDYQLRSTGSTPKTGAQTAMNIPAKEISYALWTSFYRGMAGNLEIPVSLSGDLKEVSVFHSVFRLFFNNDQGNNEHGVQIVNPFSVDNIIDSARISGPLCTPDAVHTSNVLWHETIFSRDGSLLMVLRSSSFHGTSDRLAIFKESSDRKASIPTYKFCAEQSIQASTPPFFHPRLPLICFKQEGNMVIWYCTITGLSSIDILSDGHTNECVSF